MKVHIEGGVTPKHRVPQQRSTHREHGGHEIFASILFLNVFLNSFDLAWIPETVKDSLNVDNDHVGMFPSDLTKDLSQKVIPPIPTKHCH